MSILVSLDGVLRSDTQTPIPEGVKLVEALRPMGRLVLLAPGPRAEADHWLRVHGVRAPEDVLDASVALHEGQPVPHRQLAVARARGAVELVVAADPELVIHAIERGITALLFSHPVLTSPKHRPDRARRSWLEIVETLEKQAEHAATKGAEDWGFE